MFCAGWLVVCALSLKDVTKSASHSLMLPCLASGLAYIHAQKIRHKDIKPANILIRQSQIFYADFGISKIFDDAADTLTDGNPGKGTNMYRAPEVAAHDPRGRSADVFSLGCVFVELLTVGCGIPLNEFAAFRGLSGGQAYHLDVDKIIRWLLHIRRRTAGFHHYCYGMLNPDPQKRIYMVDLVRWMACDRDYLKLWEGSRGCECLGTAAVGEFWTHSLGNRAPILQSKLDVEGSTISWKDAEERWIVILRWRQYSVGDIPDLLETIAPHGTDDFPVDARSFFEDENNEDEGYAVVLRG